MNKSNHFISELLSGKFNRQFERIISSSWNSRVFLSLVVLLAFGFVASYGQGSLKENSDPKKVYIGNIISNAHLDNPESFRGGLADQHLTEEYNAVVLENYMKMSFVLPSNQPANIHDLTVEELQSLLTTDKIEKFLTQSAWSGMRKRGHAMIWFNQAPAWLDLVGPTWTGQQVFDFSRKYILALGRICGDRIDEWDVINEAISDRAPNGERIWRERTWYRRANDGSMTDWGVATYENYIKMLFVWAREAQPNARLHINDYGIEAFNSSVASKNRFMRDQVKALKACGAPIDGVGFQSHLTLSDMVDENGNLNTNYIDLIQQSMQDLATEDIEVAITELDIRICNEDRDEAFQELAFRAYCEMAWSQPNCHEVLIWGLRDEDNWITLRNDQFFAGCQDAVIVEGDNYSSKPAYNGVVQALSALPDRNQYGFATLVQGNGAPADCGGTGRIIADILQVEGPSTVIPGEEVSVSVSYLASGDQDIVVWFQLDRDSFTVYSQTIEEVSAGSGKIDVTVEVPSNVPPGNLQYRYLAYITPRGQGFPGKINELFKNRISVLGKDSELIVSISGPDKVTQGDSVDVALRYSAKVGQEVVIWFQLDQSPFTTFQEFRQTADTGFNEIVARLYIPPSVPVAMDAYQYQGILVPTGGSWPERISSLNQANVDVEMISNVNVDTDDFIQFQVYPNPTYGNCVLNLPKGNIPTEIKIQSSLGQTLENYLIPEGVEEFDLNLSELPGGLYWISVSQGNSYGSQCVLKP